MTRILPVLLFAICIAIAAMLAITARPLWPAALAIAIAGAALALALRNGPDGEGSDDYRIAALEDANANLRAGLDETRSTVNELAELIEQLAEAEKTDLSPEIAALHDRIADLATRLDSAEAERFSAVMSEENDNAAPDTPAAGPPAPSQPPEQLRALMAGPGARPAATEPAAPAPAPEDDSLPVRLTPVFAPGLGTPAAFVIAAASETDAAARVFAQAARIAGQLEDGGRDVRLFVEISAPALAEPDTREAILRLIAGNEALRRRMTLMTPQAGFDESAQTALAAIAAQGCSFALEDVRDWSLNLAGLARSGLTHIAVDGPAMARSAREQGGDPKRLAEALGVHGIALIAGGVAERAQLDAVKGLTPALVMGGGLGPARVMESMA